MSQTTNLNVSPYFDDFDENDNYYKVLFKPGVPVQARELTGLQSILQNQIAKFGQHFFKEGSKVIPGNTTYIDNYKCVVINKEYLGITVESYIDQLLNQKIFGTTSGISGTVVQIVKSADSIDGEITLYVHYESQGVESADAVEFQNGENIITNIDILSGPENSTFIPAGEAFASTFSFDCTATGSAFSINEGVYFIRGNFVTVNSETIILDQYFPTPTGRIGLKIVEDTINSDEDANLTDNSKGFNNFAAPGADRLKISCSLAFKDIDDFNDDDFVELATVRNGNLTTKTTTSQYNLIADELARRTFDESGDYITKPFQIKVRESANNGVGNNGVYPEGQITQDGSVASEEIGLYQVSSGKAYVKGYEVNKQNTEFVDFDKPRTVKKLENQAINYHTGASVRLNRVLGSPEIGIGNTYIVSLRDQRTGAQSAANIMSAPGEEIGLARVYDFALESGAYNTSTPTANEWDISLYDIQTFTKITLNANHTLSTPTFIKGKYSGASGFLRSAVSASTSLQVYETNGEFVPNEPLIFNGIENSRVSVAVTNFGMRDVKSIFGGPGLTDQNSGDVGFARTFTGDIKLRDEFIFGSANVTSSTNTGGSGVSTITSGNPQFPGKLKVGNILKFGGLGKNTKTLARITEVNANDVLVTGVTTVSGVAEGFLPLGSVNTSVEVPDLTLVTTPFEKSDDNTLFTPLPKSLISDVDLSNATLAIRKVFNVVISASTDALTGAVTAGDNTTFLPFDEERYSLIRADGTIETLTDDKFTFTNGNGTLQISNIGTDLSANQEATLIATLNKIKPTAKVKRKNVVNSLVVDKSKLSGSGIGRTTLNDGLTFGSYPFGTRVQDEKISLNTPDVLDILGVFESTDTSDPSAPKMTLSSINTVDGGTTDLLIGEQVKGLTSGTIAIYTEQLTDSQISYVPLNESEFVEGESLLFENSDVQAIVNTIDVPSRNISADFTFNSGQTSTLFNHGFITRKSNIDAPTKKIKIYFSNSFFESDDTGDITTVNSYGDLDYRNDIQFINDFRNTDILDIRPRVSNYSVSESNRSPLEFLGRELNASGNSASNILASDESITIDFSFYLGRIDKLYLTKGGRISWIPGTPAEVPDPPVATDDALELATITLPPYLFDVSEATMSFLKHRRYRMSDIRKLETRIKNLEYYSALTLLETATANLFVPDEDGLNKFKSGFFVDNFTTFQPQESEIPVKNSIDTTNKELRPSHYTSSIDLQVGPVEGEVSIFTGAAPEGVNIRKTGDVITLDYDEVQYLNQPFGTRSESVTPFLLNFWEGFVKLTPSSDTWVNTVRLEDNVFETEGNFADVIRTAERRYGGFDTQTGLTPIVWGGWQTCWTGTRKETKVTKRKEVTGRKVTRKTTGNQWKDIQKTTTTTFQDTFTETFRDGTESRDGSRQLITEQFDQTSLGDRTISTAIIPTIRSRNVAFDGKGFLPQATMFAFFDGVDVTKYCVPKLIEIEMTSGSFQVGETVTGTIKTNPNLASDPPYIKFRVAVSNHKEGPHDAPTKRYLRNPYTDKQVSTLALESFGGNVGQILAGGGGSSSIIPSTYSSTSTLLNVDTMSLANQPQGDFFGYIQTGMILKGGTSGAEAKITNLRLVVDFTSTVQGSFYIPNPNVNTNPVFQTGERDFLLTDDVDNNPSDSTTTGKDIYTASGSVQTVQENIVSVRNAKIVNLYSSQDRAVSESIGQTFVTDELGSETTSKVIRYGRIKRNRRGGGGGKKCFMPGTLMTLADGSQKKIEEIKVGTKLLGDNNVINEVKVVLDAKTDGRRLVNINNKGFFVTEDHPFMTNDGWKSCNKEMSNENYSFLKVDQLKIGDEIKIKDNKFENISSIEFKEVDPDTDLHNFTLDGDHTYIANDFVSHNKCFMPGTLMTLADGSQKKVEEIEVGTKLLGNNNSINEVKTVLNPKTEGRKLANINNKGYFVTEDHPFMTTDGWKSCNKEMSRENYPELEINQLEVGDQIKIKDNKFEKITSIELKEVDPNTDLHNFTLDGDHTYVANDFVAHNKCFMPGTLMTLPDGSQKKVEEIKVGDKLLGLSDAINEVKIVLNPKTEGRKLANINSKGFFVTEDHPFMTTDGWKSCNKEMSNENYPYLEVNQLEIGDEIRSKGNEVEKVTSIELKEVDPDTNLHNFTLDGDNTYIANDLVAHNKCFMPGTLMTLADGSQKKIEEIEVGDKLLGLSEAINEVKVVLNPKTEGRKLANINGKGFFVTEDHPFMTTDGWKSCNKEMSNENYPDLEINQLEIGDEIKCKGDKVEKITSIELKEVDADTDLHNFTLDGDHTYIANDYIAHNKCFMPGTLMTLADGSQKKIEEIEVGTKLLGNNNIINEVKAVLNPKTEGRKLANINDKGYFVTEDHPFRTTHGWKSCNKEMSNENYPHLDIDQLEIGDWIKIKDNEYEKVTSIELKEVDPDTDLHNFTLDGDHTYVANKYVAHNKCFMPGTLMTLADGSQKKIEEIEVGTKLLGDNNVINEVLIVLDAKTGGRKLANINGKGFFATEDHPFMTKDGWKSCNKEMSDEKYSFLRVGQLEIGDEIKIKDNKFEKITSIELKEVDPDTDLHNFTLDGDHTYIANEYVSHNKGGNGCFMPNTLMTLADGSKKKIEEIEVGNKLLGLFDTINEVKEILNPKTNGRKLVNINDKGFFVTEDHPFMTTNGWKSTNKEMSRENYPDLEVDQLKIGDEIRSKGNEVEKVFSIEFKEVDPDTDLHNFTLDGDHTYIANDLVAHNKRGGGRGNEKAGDPLAQSFFIKEESGVFLTSCELFFERKDPNEIPVTIQIRTMKTGLPTTEVVPFSEVTLDPNEVNTSTNGSVPTKFTFESPVYLEGGTEYVVVVKSVSLKYKVFISRIGENDLITDEFVSNQPTLGSLFKSQNASTWEPSQWEDLKFILNRAEFVLEGTVELYNPILSRGNYQIPNLMPDALQTHSKKVRVGLSSAFGAGIHPTFGNTIYQQGSNVTGNLVGTAGAASGDLTVTRAGVGYTPASGNRGLIGVALTTITGSGVNATANVHFESGVAVAATIASGGQGYQVGDLLGITTNLGINARLSVVSIAATSELIIDNIQGVFLTGAGTTLMYGTADGDIGSTKAGVGSAICGNGGSSGAFIPDGTVISVTDGLHITVNHKNHGMYHEQNLVTISDVASDTIPTKLSVPYNNSSTDPITVDNIGILTSFENVSVAATNPGYVKIKNEIIKYTGVSAFSGQGTITGVTRAQDSTSAQNYDKGDLVQKYELGGVSLRRINRTHDFREVTDTNPIKLDSYKIKLNMGEQGIGRSTSTVESYPALFLDQTKSTGGLNIRATQNMPFEIITPMIQNMTVADTTIEASIRTVSGTSINDGSGEGTDVPFIDKGTESIALDDVNYFDSPRVIASRVNELNTATLDVLPGDRSFNMSLRLLSGDNLLSPVIDTQRMNAILTSNRIDNVIGDITIDNRVDTLLEDPSSAVYVSKENTLETSATSLKIIVDAHVNRYGDIRAFYAISNSQGTEPTFIPFPGYDNLDENGRVRTSDKNSGRPDALIAKSDPTGFAPEDLQYKEYTFTANELPSFKTFRIKFLMTSTNQAFVPRLTSLKVIATA